MIRATKTIHTTDGPCFAGDFITLKPAEARAYIAAGEAIVPTDAIETTSFVQPLPYRKRARRIRELKTNANRLETDNRAN